MATEIERKFLLKDDLWRLHIDSRETLTDGLLAVSAAGKLRVRLYESGATLTLKSAPRGIVRDEYEYEIPLADAEEMLQSQCGEHVLVKTRNYIEHLGFVWEVDGYHGLLAGIV